MRLPALIAIVVGVISLLFGLFLAIKPLLAIKMQQKFYRWINWEMKPISMEKELRNTQFMGLILILVTFIVLLVFLAEPAWFKRYCPLNNFFRV